MITFDDACSVASVDVCICCFTPLLSRINSAAPVVAFFSRVSVLNGVVLGIDGKAQMIEAGLLRVERWLRWPARSSRHSAPPDGCGVGAAQLVAVSRGPVRIPRLGHRP